MHVNQQHSKSSCFQHYKIPCHNQRKYILSLLISIIQINCIVAEPVPTCGPVKIYHLWSVCPKAVDLNDWNQQWKDIFPLIVVWNLLVLEAQGLWMPLIHMHGIDKSKFLIHRSVSTDRRKDPMLMLGKKTHCNIWWTIVFTGYTDQDRVTEIVLVF